MISRVSLSRPCWTRRGTLSCAWNMTMAKRSDMHTLDWAYVATTNEGSLWNAAKASTSPWHCRTGRGAASRNRRARRETSLRGHLRTCQPDHGKISRCPKARPCIFLCRAMHHRPLLPQRRRALCYHRHRRPPVVTERDHNIHRIPPTSFFALRWLPSPGSA